MRISLRSAPILSSSTAVRENAGAALIKSFIRQLEKMNKDPDTVPSELSYFKSNIGSFDVPG